MANATRSDVDLAQQLSDLTDLVTPFAIQAAAALRIPDALASGPLPVANLAETLGCHAPSLRRLLNTLSRKGIFIEAEPGVFGLAPLGELLRADHPVSLLEANVPWLPNVASLNDLAYSVRTGRAAFEHVHGANLWQYLAANPADAEHFDRQMRSISGFETESLLQTYDWTSVRSVADIGGGDGTLLTLLLARHPGIEGTLFELPQLVTKATESTESTVDGMAGGVAPRLSTVAGDFFVDDLPGGRDVYVLKRIVYGFGDADAMRLLVNLRKAVAPGGRVLVVEPFTRAGTVEDSYFTHRVDLLMLAVPGGRVRSEGELTSMLGAAGFVVRTVIGSATPAIEALPG